MLLHHKKRKKIFTDVKAFSMITIKSGSYLIIIHLKLKRNFKIEKDNKKHV